MKSFAFISLAALDLAKEAHELKLGMTRESPRQVLMHHFLIFIQRYYSNRIYYSSCKCAGAHKSMTDFFFFIITQLIL